MEGEDLKLETTSSEVINDTNEVTPLIGTEEATTRDETYSASSRHASISPLVIESEVASAYKFDEQAATALVEDSKADQHLYPASTSAEAEEMEQMTPSENDDTEEVAEISITLCPYVGTLLCIWRFLSTWFCDFRFLIVLQILLLAMPISTGFMAAAYMESCPMNPNVPYTMMMLGVLPLLVLLSRIVLQLYMKYSPRAENWQSRWWTILMGDGLTLFFFCLELYGFFVQQPSFNRYDSNYCHPIFYNFTFWMNCATLVLIALYLMFHLPRWLRIRRTV